MVGNVSDVNDKLLLFSCKLQQVVTMKRSFTPFLPLGTRKDTLSYDMNQIHID